MGQWNFQGPGQTQPREEVSNPGLSSRRGPFGWWLNLTAPPKPQRILEVGPRERMRKAELTSYSILAVFAFLLALVSNSLEDPATAEAVIGMAIGLFIAAMLNRFGRVRAAAYLVPILLMAFITLAIVSAIGLDALLLPAYDLYALPIFLSSLIIGRRAPWIFGFTAIGIIVASFLLLPHLLITATTPPSGTAKDFDTIAYYTSIFNIWGMVNRHVGLNLFAAFFGWLGARSVDNAITRADRAEELAELERRELDRTHELEEGVRQLLAVHVHLANGDFNVRAPAIRNSLLWQIGSSLNNLTARLGRMAQADFVLRRTQEEANRLVEGLMLLRSGRQPIWPGLSNTPLDRVVEALRSLTTPPSGAAGAAGALGQQPWSPQLPSAAATPYPPSGVPDYPSAAHPGNQSGSGQVPEWMRTLMPGGAPAPDAGGTPSAPQYPYSGQMPPAPPYGGARPASPISDPMSGYGSPNQGYPGQPGQPPANNPWSIESNNPPVDDNDLPEWLRPSNQE